MQRGPMLGKRIENLSSYPNPGYKGWFMQQGPMLGKRIGNLSSNPNPGYKG